MDNFKTVYLYNGTPFLVSLDENEEYIYPQQPFTDVAPPTGIYSPFYFDGNKWIGTNREEWLESLPKKESDIPNLYDFLNAQLLANDLDHNAKIEDLQQDIANLTAELLKIQGGMSDVHDS